MAQTKRKRKPKHRGNAAGQVEVRGRSSTKPPEGSKRLNAKRTAAQVRADRLNRPPTWRSATTRAAIATVIFVIALLLLFKESVGATVGLAGFIFLFYIPLGYYTDKLLYERRMKKKAA